MEKQIRNANKQSKETSKAKRKVSPLSYKRRNDRNTLHTLPGAPEARQQISEALELVIPCRTGKPDRIKPLYLVETNELGGPERGYWQCEQCTKIYHTRKAWAKHAGMVSNITGTYTGGTV
jgi:hypothetical protein